MLAQLPALLAEQAGGAENTALINWWTLVAQVVNFLVLVLLLRHFLYGRVVRALDQRDQKIAPTLRPPSRSSRTPRPRPRPSSARRTNSTGSVSRCSPRPVSRPTSIARS